MTAAARPAESRRARLVPNLRLALGEGADSTVFAAAAIAAAVELAALRLFTRTAIHIPALEELSGPFRVASAVSRYAYYAAVVLLGVALLLVMRTRPRAALVERQAAAAAALFVLIALAARADVVPAVFVYTALSAAVVVLALAVGAARRGWGRVAVWAFAGAAAAAGAHAAAQELSGQGLRMESGGVFLLGAELLGVGAALTVPLAAAVAPSRRQALLAGLVGVLALGMFVAAGGSTARILLLWNFGLGGYLPSVVYAVAAGAVALGLAAGGRRSAWSGSRLGALLVLCGGVGLHSTYQTGLVVLGLALLARDGTPEEPAQRPSPDSSR